MVGGRGFLAWAALTAVGCAGGASAPERMTRASSKAIVSSVPPAAARERSKLLGEQEAPRPKVLATLGAPRRAHRGTIWDGCLLGEDTFLTTGADSTIRIWDVPSGQSRGVLALASSMGEIACARDGSRFAVADHSVVELRDGATGKIERSLRLEGFTRALAFSPNGGELARVDDKCRTSVIDPSGAVRVLPPSSAPSPGVLGAVAWDAAGETIASSCGSVEADPGIELFTAARSVPARHFDRPGPPRGHVGSLSFFRGSLYVTTDELFVVDPKELAIRERARIGPERSRTLFFEPSPDSRHLALFHRDHLEIRSSPRGEPLAKLDGRIDEVRWVDNRHLAASFDHELRWLELGANGLTEQGAVPSLRGEVRALAVSLDQRWLAAGDDAGQLVVFDLLAGGAPRRLRDERGAARDLGFTPEGALLATHEESILRFEAVTFRRTHAIASPGRGAFESKGAVGAIGQHEIFLFDKDGKPNIAERKAELAAISPDGAWLVEIDTGRHRAAVVDRKAHKASRTFEIGKGQAECLLSIDQSLLACRGTSGYLWARAFDVVTGATLFSMDESTVKDLLDLCPAPRLLVFNDEKRGLCADALDGTAPTCLGPEIFPMVRAARVIRYKGAPALAVGGAAGVVEIVSL